MNTAQNGIQIIVQIKINFVLFTTEKKNLVTAQKSDNTTLAKPLNLPPWARMRFKGHQ